MQMEIAQGTKHESNLRCSLHTAESLQMRNKDQGIVHSEVVRCRMSDIVHELCTQIHQSGPVTCQRCDGNKDGRP